MLPHLRAVFNYMPQRIGKNHPFWKGNKASYIPKHAWVYRWYGKANKCEAYLIGLTCKNISKKYHWANISKKYLRIKKDWIMLCVSCHKIYDLPKGWTSWNRILEELILKKDIK